MKKILMSFLMMAMIAGCVQQAPTEAEKPEEPPVIEQPEKPVEQEKPEETEYVKKIDESKEYVYIKETKDKAYNNSFKELANNYTFENFDKDDLLQWLAIFYMPDPKDEHLVLNMKGETANSLNELFTELYEEPKTLYCEWKWMVNHNVLTIVNKSGSFIPFSTGSAHYQAFHIDLHTGELLTNEDLLKMFDVDKNLIQIRIDEYGEINKFYKEPENTMERIDGTLGMMVLNRNEVYNTIGYGYSDYSLLVPDENNLFFILGVYDFNFNGRILFHKVKLT